VTHAFLRAFAELYRRNGLAVAMAVSFGMALFLIAGIASQGHLFVPGLGADFYAVFPHNTLVILFGLPAVWSLVALWWASSVSGGRFRPRMNPLPGWMPSARRQRRCSRLSRRRPWRRLQQ